MIMNNPLTMPEYWNIGDAFSVSPQNMRAAVSYAL
jgi:hypothetical protein